MKPQEMRALSPDELTARVTDWQEELFRARSNNVLGQLNNPNELRDLRRRIARAKTIITEKTRDGAEQS